MTFKTRLGEKGTSRQVPKERQFQARTQQVQGTANRPTCLWLRASLGVPKRPGNSGRTLETTIRTLIVIPGTMGNLHGILNQQVK